LVGRGGIDEPISYCECIKDGLLSLILWNLKDTKANCRHVNAIIQGYERGFWLSLRIHNYQLNNLKYFKSRGHGIENKI
jgi:hypothetical protein